MSGVFAVRPDREVGYLILWFFGHFPSPSGEGFSARSAGTHGVRVRRNFHPGGGPAAIRERKTIRQSHHPRNVDIVVYNVAKP